MTVLFVAAWFALLAGIGEVALRGVQKYAFDGVLRVSMQFVWMAPVADLVFFLSVALLLLAAGALLPRLRWPRFVLFVFLFLTLLAWLMVPRSIVGWPWYLLALGGAVPLSALLAQRYPGFTRLMRRTLPALAVVVALLAIGVNAGRALGEWRARRALPPAAAGASNVILIIWDTVRAASLSLYGNERPTTPNLERLAERGATFARAISPSSWTLPSHAAMFTGRLPHQMSGAWSFPLDDTHPTIAEAMADAGYDTGGFAANTLYVEWEFGLSRGFLHFEDYRITFDLILRTSSLGRRLLAGHGVGSAGVIRRILGDDNREIGRKTAEMVNADLLEWLDGRDRPFFAFLNYFDAHLPYDPPAPYDTMLGPARKTRPLMDRVQRVLDGTGQWDLTPEELATEVRAYESSIAYLDAQLGALLDSLDARGILDNTLVIVTSDHGESFGEHGKWEHGTSLYFPETHVPLVVSFPGRVPEGIVVDEPVSLRSIATSVVDLVDVPGAAFPGASLARFWSDEPAPVTSFVESELSPGRDRGRRMTAVLANGYYYIENIEADAELYDVTVDWAQSNDLIGRKTDIAAMLQELTESVKACAPTAACTSHSTPWLEATRAWPRGMPDARSARQDAGDGHDDQGPRG